MAEPREVACAVNIEVFYSDPSLNVIAAAFLSDYVAEVLKLSPPPLLVIDVLDSL